MKQQHRRRFEAGRFHTNAEAARFLDRREYVYVYVCLSSGGMENLFPDLKSVFRVLSPQVYRVAKTSLMRSGLLT